MRQGTFHMRLLVWSIAVLFLAMAVVFWLMGRGLEAEAVREARERALRELDAVQWLIHGHQGFKNAEEFQLWVSGLGKALDIRVTYVVDGRVVADSSVPSSRLGELEDHSERPEILAAQLHGPGMDERMSATLGRRMIYVARETKAVEGVGKGVLRLAVPFSMVQDVVGRMRLQMGLVLAVALAVAALAAYLLSRGLTRSIKEFSALAGTIGQGDHARRIRTLPGGEFAPLAEAVNNMAERIERDVSLIREQRSLFKAVFEGVQEGIVVLDTQGRVETHNPAAADVYPALADHRKGLFLEVARDMDIQQVVDTLLAGPPDRARAMRLPGIVSGERHFEVAAVPIVEESGVRRVVLAFHDVTDIKRSKQVLEDFVANVSHQLRTPLTSIKGYAETLLDAPPKDPEQARSFLSIVVNNADHLSRVVAGMLALAGSERSGGKAARGPVDAASVVAEAVRELSWQARDKGVEVLVEAPESGPMVLARGDGLFQVVRNLVENAIAYGPRGGTVSVRIEESGGEAEFRVMDQGQGIPRKYRERVFDRFFRLDPNTVEAGGNAGLGLAICRQIVENFGGRIRVEEHRDGGAVFVFTLPIAPAGEQERQERPQAGDGG